MMDGLDEAGSGQVDEFDVAAAKVLDEQKTALRTSVYAALQSNPDLAARTVQLSRKTGIPAGMIESNLPDVERNVRLDEFDKLLLNSPTTAQWVADSQERAKIAHDDTENLTATDKALRMLGRVARAPFAGLSDFNAAAWGIGQAAAAAGAELIDPLARMVLPENPLSRIAAEMGGLRLAAEGLAKDTQGDMTGAGFYERGVVSGFRSFGSMAPGMMLSILTGNPTPALTVSGLTAGGQAASKALDAGRSPFQALQYAAEDSGAEVLPEMFPIGRLLFDIKNGAPFLKILAHQIMTEVPTEVASTAWQNFNEWMNINPDQTPAEYLKQLGPDEAETIISTLTMTLLTAGLGKGLGAMAIRADRGEKDAKTIEDLNKLAAASKVLARDPQTFEDFVAKAAEDGPVQHVFIDANDLLQSGLAAQIAEVSPSVAAQLQVEGRIGGTIVIPIEEYAARIAPTEHAKVLLDHLRTQQDGFSRAQAKSFRERHIDELQAEMTRVLAEKGSDDAFKADMEAVRQQILDDLNATGRFTTDVMESYAMPFASYYAVRASQLGMTAQELYASRRVQFRAGGEIGGDAEQPSYHGSPHQFARFDLSRMGSGEGAQAYGWGQYFADHPNVAKAYVPRDHDQEAAMLAQYQQAERSGDYTTAEVWEAALMHDTPQEIRERFSGEGYDEDHRLAADAVASWIEQNPAKSGRLYSVEIPDDAVSRMLDRDKPFSEQPESVRAALEPLRELYRSTNGQQGLNIAPDTTGQEIYNELALQADPPDGRTITHMQRLDRQQQGASEKLAELGIPGLRYLDQGSRGGGESTRNTVVWDQALLDRISDSLQTLYQSGTESDAEAAQREHAETERAYGGREAYEAAKAAGQTKLNFTQWVQVRTPRFKQWFGDWELSALRDTMRNATGSDLARRAAAEFLRQPITNVETGLSAVVSKGSLDKMLSRSAVGNSVSPQAHAMAVANLDKLFMLATRRLERPPVREGDRGRISAIHHFDAPMPFGGDVLRVKMLVKETAQAGQANPLYTVSAVEIEKPASSRGESSSEGVRSPAPPAGFEARFAQMVAAVNGEGVSTVTDPDTGEPLVVYHGAPDARFLGDDSTFKSERERYGGAMGRAEAAHWFASSRRVASTYADARRAFDYQNAEPGVLDAWLQLKNPLVIDAGGAHWRTAQQRGKTSDVIEQARRDGHDGVIIRRVRDDYSTLESGKRGEIADTYAVFSSPQIKSATANVGTFSQDDGNILHQAGAETTLVQEMQRARAARAQFETDVDAAMARTGKQSHMARLGQPSAVLRALGLPNLPVVVSRSELQENRHGIPDRIIKSMPILMADPVAVFKSADPRHPDRLVVVTSAMHNGGPVVAVVQPNAWSNMGPVNLVTSFHARGPAAQAKRTIESWLANENGLLRYLNKRKGPELEGAIGVQFPKVQPEQGLAGAKVLSEADVFKPAGEKPLTQGQAAPRGSFPRGSFSRDSLTVKLLHGADLTTVMHEGAHFFFENDIAMATELAAEARANGIEALKPGERQILADVSALFRQHGIQGDIIDQLDQWHSMSPEEQRSHHERTAEWFETYLASGKAPSIEMQPYFRKFRQWFLNVYGSVKRFIDRNPEAGKINDEVRGVFDRMLATNEQIVLAEQARSMIPIFETAEQAGMRPEEFQAYQALNMGQTQKAVEELQARALDDMRWIRGIRSRAIKRLTREERGQRSQMRIEARREVMSQPVYIAWRFLTGKITKEDRIGPLKDAQSNPDHVMPDRDSLFTAIAKLGGVDRAEVKAQWGVDQKTQIAMPVFGKPVMRKTGGRSIDSMGQALAEEGYLPVDEHGKYDMGQFEDMFLAELRGDVQYSMRFNPDTKADGKLAGEQVANPGALGAGRIDAASLQFMDLPDGVADAIRARGMTAANGLRPDILADTIGFSSGDELLQALAAAKPPQEVIETLTQERMVQRFGDLATPEAIEQAADRAVHNEVRTRMLEAEANALSRAVGRRGILRDAARELAAQIVSRTRVRDLLPQKYANSAARAGKAAQAARNAGNIAQAAMEKRNQLINTYAARAVYDAREEFDKGLRYLRRFTGNVKSMDPAYVDQIHQLLERFNLRPMSRDKMDKRASFVDWLQAQEEAGTPPDIDPALVAEANRKPVKEMSVEEFRGLVDAVRQIAHLGRLKNRLMTDKQRREYQAVRDEMVASINDHARGRTASNLEPVTKGEKAEKGARWFLASSLTMSNITRILDGGDENGPVWRYLVRPANEASSREATMNAEATLALSKILDPVIKLGGTTGKGKYFASVGRSFNREQRFVVALNWGNEGNRQRMLDGEGWTAEQLRPVLESLTEAEWQAAQQVWDYMNTTYRPLIAAKERRIYGREPKWVEAAPFTIRTADGKDIDLQGGYYPIRFNPERSLASAQHSAAEEARQQLRGAYTSVTTRRSFTKARADEVKGRPLMYSLSGLYHGVSEVIHDLAFHEILIDANRLLRSNTIDRAIRDQYGADVTATMRKWVGDLAQGNRLEQNAADRLIGKLRQGVSVAGLGFNLMSAVVQPLGLTQSFAMVNTRHMLRGLAQFVTHPLSMSSQVNEKSEMMRNRARTRFRELNELRNSVERQGLVKRIVGQLGYLPMVLAERAASVPTWQARYEQALADGLLEDDAIALADQTVIDTQGGGQIADLSAFERGGNAQKLFTVFYNFMKLPFNLMVRKAITADTPTQKAKLAVDFLLLYAVAATLESLLRDLLTPGDDGWDDTEKIARKLVAANLSYMMGSVFMLREFSEASKIVTGAGNAFDYSGPAGVRLIPDTIRLTRQLSRIPEDGMDAFDLAFFKATMNVVGVAFGLPAAQVNRFATGLDALTEGDTENLAALAFGYRDNR